MTARLGIDDGVLDRAEVIEALAGNREVAARADDLRAPVHVRSKTRLLRRNAQHPKDRAAEVLGNATVGIGKLVRLVGSRRRELQDPDGVLERNGDLLAVRAIIGTTALPLRNLSRKYSACSCVIA